MPSDIGYGSFVYVLGLRDWVVLSSVEDGMDLLSLESKLRVT